MSVGSFASSLADRLDPPNENTASTWRGWRDRARPEQLPPAGDPRVWYIRGGRDSGKTWTGSNALAEAIIEGPPGSEWAVIAPTFGDARDTCMESGESGLIKALGGKAGPGGTLLVKGPHLATWNRSMGELWLRNGTIVYADGADDGALRIQGKNLRGAWCDELGLWKRWKTAWDESVEYAVRKAPARIIATGTPKRNMPAIALVRRLLADDTVAKSLLLTESNAVNIHPATLSKWLTKKGTPLGKQELEGAVLDEVQGALWSRDEERARALGLGLIVVEPAVADGVELGRRVLAVDPSDGEDDSDEYGLAVVTVGDDGRFYVLASDGVRLGPDGNVEHTQSMFDAWTADVCVVEKNHGGGYLPAMLRAKGLPVQVVTASQGKRTRAEPVAALYGQHGPGVVHVGGFAELEDQLTSFTGAPGEVSPDRLDALVWGLAALSGVRARRKLTHVGRATSPPSQVRVDVA